MKGVRRVTVLAPDEGGSLTPVRTLKNKKKKRKNSRGMKMTERNVRIFNDALRAYADEMDARHDKSSRKKKDGWLRDNRKNMMKASRKSMKKLRKIRFV